MGRPESQQHRATEDSLAMISELVHLIAALSEHPLTGPERQLLAQIYHTLCRLRAHLITQRQQLQQDYR